MKKFAALLLALTMVLGMATITASAEGSERVITIGTTWDLYWDSFDGSIEDNPYYSGTTADEMKFAKVKQIEEKWGVKFEYINLTYAGAKESINTSVLAGTPDVDVYMMDLALAAPAAANGYVIDMRDVLPADNTVIQGKGRCAVLHRHRQRRCAAAVRQQRGKHGRFYHAAGVQPADD